MTTNGTIQNTNPLANPIEQDANSAKYAVDLQYPGDRVASVTVRVGRGDADARAAAEVQAHHQLLKLDTATFTENLEKDLSKAMERWNAVTYDPKTGEALPSITGRDRDNLSMRIQNLRRSLVIAEQDRVAALHLQAEDQKQQQQSRARIDAAAKVRAREILEQEEVEKLAQLEASRLRAAASPRGEG